MRLSQFPSPVRGFMRWLGLALCRLGVDSVSYGDQRIRVLEGAEVLRFLAPRSKEERFLSNLNLEGRVIYDIGAYRGLLTCFFAMRTGPDGEVVAFEPGPRNFAALQRRIEINGLGNVMVFQVGVSESDGDAVLVAKKGRAATGSIQREIQESYIRSEHFESVDIRVATLDSCVVDCGLPPPDFIKIDTEGCEVGVLAGSKLTLERHRPDLFIEVHGASEEAKHANAHELLETLRSRGYAIRHVESGLEVTEDDCSHAKEGHLYCRPNAR